MRAILVSVDYTDLLRLTLPYNRHHFDQVMVVTSRADLINVKPLCDQHEAICYPTDAFYDDGAEFNKWKALEEALDVYGRYGWMCLMDADVLWPKDISGLWRYARCGILYTPMRRMWTQWPHNPLPIRCSDRMLADCRVPSETHWGEFPLHPQQREWAGYTQIFHGDDPVLRWCGNCEGGLCSIERHRNQDGSLGVCRWECGIWGKGTCQKFAWHQTNWRHAGGADSIFQAKWPQECKVRPPFEVLHLGPAGLNWCGRSTPYWDGTTHTSARERAARVRQFILGRRVLPGDDRFKGEKVSQTPPSPQAPTS